LDFGFGLLETWGGGKKNPSLLFGAVVKLLFILLQVLHRGMNN